MPRRSKSIARAAAGGAVALALVASSPRAAAKPLEAALVVREGDCLEAREIAAHVAGWLGTDDVGEGISIVVERVADGVHYVIRDGPALAGERTRSLGTFECADVPAALALAIAVAIDANVLGPIGVEPQSPPTPSIEPHIAEKNAAPQSEKTETVRPRLDRSPIPPSAGFDASALFNVLPATAFAVAPAIDVPIARFADLRASALFTTDVTVPLERGTVTTHLAAGRADACLVSRWDAARARVCAGALAGVATSEGRGYATSLAASAAWVAPAGRFEARWARGRFGLVAAVDVFVAAVRPSLDVTGPGGSSRKYPAAGVVAGIGPSVDFW